MSELYLRDRKQVALLQVEVDRRSKNELKTWCKNHNTSRSRLVRHLIKEKTGIDMFFYEKQETADLKAKKEKQ